MATACLRAWCLGVLLTLALCLAAAERQPANRYISYAGLPRTARNGGRNGAATPRGIGRSAIWAGTGRCKNCHGQPPTKAAVAEYKGTDTSHAAAVMTGAKIKAAAAGSEGAYISPAPLTEEKRRYISNAALKHDKPRGKCPLSLPSCA